MSLPHNCECKICQRTLNDSLLHATSMDELAYLSKPEGSLHKRDTSTHVFFYEQEFYVLSNFSSFQVWWPSENLEHAGAWHQTSEHLYHYLKFRPDDGKDANEIGRIIGVKHRIFNAISAHRAFEIAQEEKQLRRPDWDDVKVEVMKNILRAKVNQHPYVKKKLLETGERILIEDSWRDSFWGWGEDKKGQNVLGTLWTEVRQEIRNAEETKND